MQVLSTDRYKDILRYTFDNGLILLTKSVKDLPIVSFRGCIRGGSFFESDDRCGLTKMLCLLLKGGTPSRTAQAIAAELDFMGTSVHFSPHYDAVYFAMSCLSKHLDQSFRCVVDLLINSHFPEHEVERLRLTALASLKRKADQPSQVALDQFHESVYGDHPYRRPLDGYEESLRVLSREDLVAYHKKVIAPGKMILTAVGDFDSTALLKSVQAHFDVPYAACNDNGLTEVTDRRVRTVRILQRDITQANICLGNIGAKRKSEDHFASLLMNYILGGSGLTSRLTHRIRTREGLAYSVHSAMAKRLLGGTFSVMMQTKNEKAGEAVRSICDEMRRMQNEYVADQELMDAKNFFKGHFPFRIETIENEAAYIEMAEFYQLGLDYLDKEIENLDRVTKEDIQLAANKYLQPDQFVLSVAGNRHELEDRLAG